MKRRLTEAERIAHLQRTSLGVGRLPLARPVPAVPTPAVPRINDRMPITSSGVLTPRRTNQWHVIRGGQSITLVMVFRPAPSADSTFQWVLDNVAVGTVITWPSGDVRVTSMQPIATAPGQLLELECLTAASDLGDPNGIGGYAEING